MFGLLEEVWELPEDQREDFVRRVRESDPDSGASLDRLMKADGRGTGVLRDEGALAFVLEEEPLPVPETLGPYRVGEELGSGGMGRVFAAERSDGNFDRRVAIKVLAHWSASGRTEGRFKEEAALLAKLEHHGITRLYDAGEQGGVTFLVMELVDGDRIDHYCDQRALGRAERCHLFEQVCAAVQSAHQQLIIHCDLKPSNVLVTRDGVVKLLDFGIGRLQVSAEEDPERPVTYQMMTPAYASPEQKRGEAPSVASDVYSLGVVLHELVTGRRPRSDFDHEGEETEIEGPEAGLGGDLEHILRMALAPDASQRYPSAQAMLDDLQNVREVRPLKTRSKSKRYVFTRFVQRNRRAVAIVSLLAVGIVAATGVALQQGRVAARERDIAVAEAAKAAEVTDFLRSVFQEATPGEDGPPASVTAEEILDRGARRLEVDLADQPAVQAEMMSVLGGLYHALARGEDAERWLRSALAQHRNLTGDGSVEAVNSLLDLARLQALRFDRSPEDEAEAIRLYREAIALSRADDDLREQLAIGLAETGGMTFVSGRSIGEEESGAMVEEAWDIASELDRPHLTANVAYHLGWWHHQFGEVTAAEHYYQIALAVRTETWGPTAPSTLTSLNQLGWFYEGLGRYEEAGELMAEALGARRIAYGAQHPRVFSALQGLGLVRLRQGNYEEAERLMRDALALTEALDLPRGEPSTRAWLAQALAGQRRTDEARREFERALELTETPDRGRTLNDYASFLRRTGELTEAEAYFRRALTSYQSTMGVEHRFSAVVAGNLASLLVQTNRPAEAIPLLVEAVQVVEGALGSTHVSLIPMLVDLGWARLVTGEGVAALEELERAHGMATDLLDPDDWRVGNAKLYLGTAFRVLGELEWAEEYLSAARENLSPHRIDRPIRWQQVNYQLGELFTQTGRGEEAALHYEAARGPSG